jgi:hypothetical protein
MAWWSRRKVLVEVLVWAVVGLGPFTYLLWWGTPDIIGPQSAPISLEPGKFTSPYFTPAADESYQIEIYFLPINRTPLDLDWKVVEGNGTVIANGSYKDEAVGGNDAILGQYVPWRRSRQRILVAIHQGENVPNSHPRLHIGLPERGLAMAYGLPIVIGWAILVAFAGAIRVLVATLVKGKTREVSSAGR